MNIYVKFLNTILATEFNNTLKKIIHHDQVGFMVEMQE
jgi:hypothetical protein